MKNNKTILLVDVGTVYGGAEVYALRLAAILQNEVTFIVLCFNSELQARLKIQGVRSICPQLPHISWIRRAGKYLVALLLVPWLIMRNGVRLVHLNGYQCSYLAWITRMMGIRTIITPHHLPQEKLTRSWYRTTAKWVDCAVNVSEASAVDHQHVLPQIRSITILNWISKPPQQRALQSKDRFCILFLGRLVHAKGLPVLLDALCKLGEEAELIVCGEGPCAEEFFQQAEGLPVTFVGFVPDLSSLYQRADAMVIPSRGPEGSCLVALEAMSWGLPCIMSDLPAYREVADEGHSALLFRPGDSDELADMLRTMIKTPDVSSRLSARALQMIASKYAPETARIAYCEAFEINDRP